MKLWKKLNTREILKGRIFSYKQVEYQSQTSDKRGDFDVIDFADWVNIIAVTPENKIVFVKQFRAGTESITLEIPGGAMEPNESPLECAVRELEEESGYQAEEFQQIGMVEPNPAFMGNKCYTYLAKNCRPTGKQNFDPLEEITVEEIDSNKVKQLLKAGEITHSLIVAAFYWYYSSEQL